MEVSILNTKKNTWLHSFRLVWFMMLFLVVIVVGPGKAGYAKEKEEVSKNTVSKEARGIERKDSLPKGDAPSALPRINSSGSLSSYSGDYGYSTLSSNGKKVYHLLSNLGYQFHSSSTNATKIEYGDSTFGYVTKGIDISAYNIYISDVEKIMFAVEADHPILFWFDGVTYSYYATKYKGDNPWDYKIDTVYLTVAPEYRTGATRGAVKKSIETGLKPYLSKIDSMRKNNKSSFEIELAVHDMIVENTEYVYNQYGEPEGAAWAHNIAGILTKKKAVCEGYAKTFQLLLNYANIPSIYAIGWGGSEGHAWNLVQLEGNWYNVDITWNDQGTKQKTYYQGVSYRYFNCLDDVFLEKHSYDSYSFNEMYPLPTVTVNGKYSYDQYFGLRFDKEEFQSVETFDQDMVEAIKTCSTRNEYLLRITVDTEWADTFKKMYLNRYTNIGSTMNTNGTRYQLGNSLYKDTFTTTSGKSVSTYYIPVTRVSLTSIANGTIYIGIPSYKAYAYVGRGKKEVTSETYSEQVDKDTLIYYQNSLLGSYQIFNTTLSISTSAKVTYTGSELKPKVTVYDGTTLLSEGKDYTIAYSNHVNVGAGKVTVTGRGKYIGTQSTTFQIHAKPMSGVTIASVKAQTYSGNVVTPSISVKEGKLGLTKGKDYTVTYQNNKNAGTATILITGKGNYTGTVKTTFVIQKRNIANCQISSIPNQEYTKNKVKPSVSIKAGQTTLKVGTDYKVVYSNNTKMGTAKVTITGIGRNITGTKTVTFKIVPKAVTKLKAVTSRRRITLTWKASKDASGYEVAYSTSKNGKYKSWNTTKKTTFTKTSLTKGKNYYVKVRPYKMVNGKKLYGKYCNYLKIRVK